MLFSTVFLFALWFEPSWLGAGWGPVGEGDAASFRSASLRAQADTQSSEHGVVATSKHDHLSSGCGVKGNVWFLGHPDAVQQHGQLSSYGNDGPVSGLLASTRSQMQTPVSQAGVLSVSSEEMIGALDEQGSEIDVARLGDAELRISLAGLAAPRSQAEIAANISASLEALFASQGQDIRQRRELAHSIDLGQSHSLRVLGFSQLLDRPVICLDLQGHVGDLLEHRAKRLNQTWW